MMDAGVLIIILAEGVRVGVHHPRRGACMDDVIAPPRLAGACVADTGRNPD